LHQITKRIFSGNETILVVSGIEAVGVLVYSNRSEVLKLGNTTRSESVGNFPDPMDGGFLLRDQNGTNIVCGGYR